MKTLHVDLGKEWRGGQHQALLLVKGLRSRGHTAEILTPADSPLAQRAQSAGITVHTTPRPAARFSAAPRLRHLLAQGNVDVLHLHDAHGLTSAWLARAHKRTAVVASRRVANPLYADRLAPRRYQNTDRILAVSEFVAQSVVASGVPCERVQVVYDGVELAPLPTPEFRRSARQAWGVADHQTLLGCVGYLLPEKGQEFLLRALPAVREKSPACHVLLAGEGPRQKELQRLARRLGLSSAVLFAGFVEDVARVYASLDVFVFPSLAEPLGSSLLSAMGFALPIVAVGHGAVPEVVEDGRTGLVIADPEPDQIAAAVVRLLQNAQWAAQLGAAARDTVRNRFSADCMVERTLTVYEQLCGERKRRQP